MIELTSRDVFELQSSKINGGKMKKKVLLVLCLLPLVLSAQLMDMPEGIAYSEFLDMYFVSCWSSENVVVVNSEGVQSEYLTGLPHCANNLLVDNILYITYGTHVKAVDTFTSEELWDIYLSGSLDADGIAMANDGYLYVVTHNNKVYKIDINQQTSELFAYGGIGTYDQGMVYDEEYNRLLICSYQTNCPIFAVSLPDGETSIAHETGLNYLDAMATDAAGNIYVTCDDSVYKYDNEFAGDPIIVSDGHAGASGIEVNNDANLLYVSNFSSGTVDVIQLPEVGIEQGNLIQPRIELYQNYPNPFNPSTTIEFSIEQNEEYGISIYNIKGELVKSLSTSLCHPEPVEVRGDNYYSVVWNGTDEKNKPVSSGIYFYKLTEGNFTQTKKMVLMK
jgi:DNA-binding beta-propeller fold protein YncE